MDKSCHSSGDLTTTANSSTRDHYLKQVNKLSHKISKPTSVKKPGFDPNPNTHHQAPPQPMPPSQSNSLGDLHQHQPPVYNINKNDFREVVQRLTGSPAHERFSTAPPTVHQPKSHSSRLHRIRPPPLASVSNRPSPLSNGAVNPPNNLNPNPFQAIGAAAGFAPRLTTPLSPLPPLPSVHTAAESPVSAYMRYLQNSISTTDSNAKQFSGFSPLAPLVSPRWYQTNSPRANAPLLQQNIAQQQQGMLPPAPTTQFQLPPLPSPIGCLNSPRSPYPLLSPSLLFSPTSGQLGFPLLPSVPVPSPK